MIFRIRIQYSDSLLTVMKFASERSLTIFISVMMVLTAIGVCLDGATIVVYATNQFFSPNNNPIIACPNTDVGPIKYQNRQLLTLIAIVMAGGGFFFGLILTIALTLSLFVKPKGRHMATKQTFKSMAYIMAALALLTTAVSFGYDLSLMQEYQNTCPSLKTALLPMVIISGIGVAFFIPVVIMTLLFPSESSDIKYSVSGKAM